MQHIPAHERRVNEAKTELEQRKQELKLARQDAKAQERRAKERRAARKVLVEISQDKKAPHASRIEAAKLLSTN